MTADTNVSSRTESLQKKFLTKVYGWMAFALVLSGASSFLGSKIIENLIVNASQTQNSSIGSFITGTILVLAVVEIILVWSLSARIQKISKTSAIVGFVVYSIINGLTLSTIFLTYTSQTIYTAFITAALTFIAMVLYGTFTKSNVRSAGKYLYMGVIGICIASFVQWILMLVTHSSFDTLSVIISIATVVLFTGLTAYDSNKMLTISGYADGSEMYEKASIIGALELYLDFINIFLALLRLFGRNRD